MSTVIALALAIISVISVSSANVVKFTKITLWSEALELAKASGKPIFLDAYTDWCGWCKVMDRETFSNAKVAEVMNASFVCVKMEMETGEGIDVAMKYRGSQAAVAGMAPPIFCEGIAKKESRYICCPLMVCLCSRKRTIR